jgi:hypothetical protein
MTDQPEKSYMALPFGRKFPLFSPSGKDLRYEVLALAVVLVVATLSWQMINGVATALYRQYEILGDPPLIPIVAAGPELGRTDPPASPSSQLGHIGYFWSERAFHYRCALMFAVNDFQDPAVLAADTWQQHPDGVNSWRQYALLMEPVYGFLYRLAGDQARPFVEFLLRLVPFIHVLIFLPLYAMARALGCRRFLAALAVIFYATCTLGFVRMTGSLLLKEDFALLCLAVFLALHFWAWRRQSITLVALAAVGLIPVLASWHLSQFLVLVIMLAAALGWAASSSREGFSATRVPFFVLMPAVYSVAGLAAGLTPSLFDRGFFISLPLAVLYAWLITAIVAWKRPPLCQTVVTRVLILAGLTAALGALVMLNRSYTGDYHHVFGLFIEKLAHGFRRPDDPGLLPFDTRVFWAPPFNTPTWGEVWSKLGFHAVVLAPVLVWCCGSLLHRGTAGITRSFLWTIPPFLAAYMMIERMGVVFLVFASVGVALFGEWLVRRLTPSLGPRALPLVAGFLLISPVLNLNGNLGDMVRIARTSRQGREVRLGASDQALWQSWKGMFSWVTANTAGPGSGMAGPPAVFLGGIGVSPQLLLYTGRPIVLNSQFENAEIRNRYRRFLEALFATDETMLWKFARDLGVGYIFINRNYATVTGPGSSAWLAGITEKLSLDMNAVRMHFKPETLTRFSPVYDNEHYRILRVLPDDSRTAPTVTWQSDHNSWWRLENFRVSGGRLEDPVADRNRLADFESALSHLQDSQREILAAVENRWRTARGQGGKRPDLMLLHRRFTQVRLDDLMSTGGKETGRLENAIRARLSEVDPLSGHPLASSLAHLADGKGGWLEQLETHQGEPLQHATCGQLLALAGRYDQAADQFAAAAELFQDPVTAGSGWRPAEIQVRLWHEEVWWRLAAGRVGQARQRARVFADNTPPGSREGDFFGRVGAILGEFE